MTNEGYRNGVSAPLWAHEVGDALGHAGGCAVAPDRRHLRPGGEKGGGGGGFGRGRPSPGSQTPEAL